MPGPETPVKSEDFMFYIPSPGPETSLSPEEWAQSLLEPGTESYRHLIEKPSKLFGGSGMKRRCVVAFENFPPEYIDYYQALQKAIAEKFKTESKSSSEPKRPFIALQIKGSERVSQNPHCRADVALAGGTGPVSDANLVCQWVAVRSDMEHGLPENMTLEDRARIADKCKNMSAVLYSMPPPRDYRPNKVNNYRKHYHHLREKWPADSLHILTNTGHSNKAAFEYDLLLGRSNLGQVRDMTVDVADSLKRAVDMGEASEVLILGTKEAHKKKLYPNLLNERGVRNQLPNDHNKLILQAIIDDVKNNNYDTDPGGRFVTFVVGLLKSPGYENVDTLLFSCTELPMLLHSKLEGREKTVLETLEDVLENDPILKKRKFKLVDTEEIFVHVINTKQQEVYAEKLGMDEQLQRDYDFMGDLFMESGNDRDRKQHPPLPLDEPPMQRELKDRVAAVQAEKTVAIANLNHDYPGESLTPRPIELIKLLDATASIDNISRWFNEHGGYDASNGMTIQAHVKDMADGVRRLCFYQVNEHGGLEALGPREAKAISGEVMQHVSELITERTSQRVAMKETSNGVTTDLGITQDPRAKPSLDR